MQEMDLEELGGVRRQRACNETFWAGRTMSWAGLGVSQACGAEGTHSPPKVLCSVTCCCSWIGEWEAHRTSHLYSIHLGISMLVGAVPAMLPAYCATMEDSSWRCTLQASLPGCSQLCSFTSAEIRTHLSLMALAEYLDINQGAVGISTEELQCLICTCCTELFCQMTPVNYQYLTLTINQMMCGP